MRKSRFEIPLPVLRLISRILLRLFFSFEVEGLHHLRDRPARSSRSPSSQGYILAGNHTGYLDSLMIYAACNRRFQFLMTEEVFSWGIIGKLVRYGNILPLYKGQERRTLVESLRLLKQGQSLCVFPEGRLTLSGEMSPFQDGVAFLQEKSGVPIIPFAIQGGFEAWAYGRPWPTFRKVRLIIGPALEFEPGQPRQHITNRLSRRIQALLEAENTTDTIAPQPL